MRTIPSTETLDDTRLVELSRNGDRDAFGRIVERYQSLICALTYSASGNFQTSEDLAQVTFITAWCQLKSLREPNKLKSWLCSIARNLTTDSLRQQQRTPTANAEELDASLSGDAATPRDRIISKEEQAILWRVLEGLPATYREPLILYYRQEQSVAEVAETLELSEDAVNQRLSRGREMLSERTTKFVETALRTSTPGKAFTLGVLAALPALVTSAKAATVGATAKAAGASGFLQSILGVAPIAALGGLVGYKMRRDAGASMRQRESVARFWRIVVGCLVAFVVLPMLLILIAVVIPMPVSKEKLFGGLTRWLGMMYVVLVAALAMWVWQRRRKIQPQGTGVEEMTGTRKKRFALWVVLAMIGMGILLAVIELPRMNRNLGTLSTAEVQEIARAHQDAKFSILQYQNGNRHLWVETHKNGKLYEFSAPADDSTLSLLKEKGIACPTHVQGRDFEILGWPGRLLVLLCIFILAAGGVLLLKRTRSKGLVF